MDVKLWAQRKKRTGTIWAEFPLFFLYKVGENVKKPIGTQRPQCPEFLFCMQISTKGISAILRLGKKNKIGSIPYKNWGFKIWKPYELCAKESISKKWALEN